MVGGVSHRLHVAGLRKSFGAQLVVDVDLTLESGDFCLILGENGVGKSTLFRCLLGLENFDGTVEVNGCPSHGDILGILDHPMMYPRWNAVANIRYILNDSHAEQRPAVRELLDDRLLRRKYGQMSTGQKKLVLLATLLASDASILLLDEFSNGLDQTTRTHFRDMLKRHLHDGDRTVIATGHDLEAFGTLPNRVMVLKDAHLVDITNEYLESKDVAATYAKHVTRNAA